MRPKHGQVDKNLNMTMEGGHKAPPLAEEMLVMNSRMDRESLVFFREELPKFQ